MGFLYNFKMDRYTLFLPRDLFEIVMEECNLDDEICVEWATGETTKKHPVDVISVLEEAVSKKYTGRIVWLYQNGLLNDPSRIDLMYVAACKPQSLGIVKWLYENNLHPSTPCIIQCVEECIVHYNWNGIEFFLDKYRGHLFEHISTFTESAIRQDRYDIGSRLLKL